MKIKLILFLIIVFGLIANGAEIRGKIKFDTQTVGEDADGKSKKIDDFGVFVYIDETGDYDITDVDGNFKMMNLSKGKEYTLVFQKGGLKDYKRKVKISQDIENINIEIKIAPGSDAKFVREKDESTQTVNGTKVERVVETKNIFIEKKPELYTVKGTIISTSDKDIFLNFRNRDFGVIVKPNTVFERKLEKGMYEGDVFQEGVYKGKLSFKVLEGLNNIGILKIESDIKYDLNVVLRKSIESGFIYLYNKDQMLVYSKKIDLRREILRIPDLSEGDYRLIIRAYGYKDYTKELNVSSSKTIDIVLEELSKMNNIFVAVTPEDAEADISLFEEDGTLVKNAEKANGGFTFEGLDPLKYYSMEISAKRYKKQTLKRLRTGDKVDINLKKEIKGAVITGNVYPFEATTEVKIFDEDLKKISKARVDQNGKYEIEMEQVKSGKKTLIVNSENFEEVTTEVNIEQGKENSNVNITLKPVVSSMSGRLRNAKGEKLSEVMVIVEELGIWQKSDKDGYFYFRDIIEGKYNLVFRKLGFKEKKVSIDVQKNQNLDLKEINLESAAKLIIKSDQKFYELYINNERENIDKLIYEKEVEIGTLEITIKKQGYIDYKNTIKIEEYGVEKEISVSLQSLYEYRENLKKQLDEISGLIDALEIEAASRKLAEVSKMKNIELFQKEVDAMKDKLTRIKRNLYDTDKEISRKIISHNTQLNEITQKDTSIQERRKLLDEKYKEIIEYTEKTLKRYPYTTMKYEIYSLQGDIYSKMGMVESASKSYDMAKKYKNN